MIVGALLLTTFTLPLKAASDTFIESADGKRLVRLESPELDKPYHAVSVEATGKTVVYVHGKEILADIHDAAILVVDDDVRHTSAGVKIATFDGDNIRHGPGGKVVMNYHHPDLCPDFHADRLYRVNGPELTKTELVAVLYALQPDMFKLSDAEVAEQKKAMAEANAEEDAGPRQTRWPGHGWSSTAAAPLKRPAKAPSPSRPNRARHIRCRLISPAAAGQAGPALASIRNCSATSSSGWPTARQKLRRLCVYEIDGGNLKGTWYPWYINGDPKNIGTETLKGPQSLNGEFKIESAKAPFTAAEYTGTVTIKPANIVGADDHQAPYLVTWNIGGNKISGIGIRHRKYLFVSSGSGADVNIAAYKIDNGSMTCDWYKAGSTEKGSAAAMK